MASTALTALFWERGKMDRSEDETGSLVGAWAKASAAQARTETTMRIRFTESLLRPSGYNGSPFGVMGEQNVTTTKRMRITQRPLTPVMREWPDDAARVYLWNRMEGRPNGHFGGDGVAIGVSGNRYCQPAQALL